MSVAEALQSAGVVSDPAPLVVFTGHRVALGDELGCAIVVRPSGMVNFITVQGDQAVRWPFSDGQGEDVLCVVSKRLADAQTVAKTVSTTHNLRNFHAQRLFGL